MSWYRDGTVAVTNGSTTVPGTGTAFVANAQVGEMFAVDGEAGYEITAVVSDTELTIAPAYAGAGASGVSYAIIPVRGPVAEAVTTLRAAVAQWTSYMGGALAGVFSGGTLALPTLRRAGDLSSGLFFEGNGVLSLVGSASRLLKLSGNTASGDCVQSSATDATAGKLLTTGAFGLGDDAGITVADLDTHYTAGFYVGFGGAHPKASSGDNPWPNVAAAFSLEVGNLEIGDAGEYVWQRVTRWSLTNVLETKMRVRTTAANGWCNWTSYYNSQSAIGPVSMNAGVPDGAIIERGSNANGDYVKFADGTLICTINDLTGAAPNITHVNIFRSNLVTWTFPASFVASPVVSGQVEQDSDWLGLRAPSTASVDIRVLSADSDAAVRNLRLQAVGRWF